MARENQGLQIALIIFVMLTIILAVTTYLFYRQYDEASLKAKSNLEDASQKAQLAAKNESDLNELKRMLGVKNDAVDAITTAFNKDMATYGGAYPEESRFYRPLIEKLAKTIEQKNTELADAKSQLKALGDEYKVREANKDPQIEKFKEEQKKAADDLASEQSKFKSERERIAQSEAKLQEDLKKYRQEGAAMLSQVEAKLQAAKSRIRSLSAITTDLSDKLEGLTSDKITSFNGEVVWVNQRSGSVWINLGQSDALSRQVTFSVYPANMSGSAVKDSKGSIEVTQILGSHLAEARILDDIAANPILPGDKIFTPLWSPGEKRRFALAGFMDIDNDGKNDLETILHLIQLNGGVVDCYIAESGKDKDKAVGAITVNTNCLILGVPPDEKGNARQLAAFTKILRDAEQLRLQKVQIGDFLQRIGYKNTSSVVRFGRGANPDDFRAKSGDGVQRRTPGNVSDVFEDREPPRSGTPGGMYHRF